MIEERKSTEVMNHEFCSTLKVYNLSEFGGKSLCLCLPGKDIFGLSYIERPKLGDNPKADKPDNEKHMLFVKSTCTFHEKHLKSNKAADSTQISHFDLVFQRVQGEGQLGMS